MKKKKIDEVGRIVVPLEMKKCIGVKNGDEVCLEIENDKIIISNIKGNVKETLETLMDSKDLSYEDVIEILKKI